MELSPKIDLALDSSTARPQNIAAELDPLNGSQLFRLMPVPDKVYPVAITLQQKAGLFTSLNQTWSPLPDEYSYIYQWGLLAEIFLFADDARATWASQKFVSHLLGANQGLSDTERNVFLQNWQAVTGNPIEKQIQLQQGNQARGGY